MDRKRCISIKRGRHLTTKSTTIIVNEPSSFRHGQEWSAITVFYALRKMAATASSFKKILKYVVNISADIGGLFPAHDCDDNDNDYGKK